MDEIKSYFYSKRHLTSLCWSEHCAYPTSIRTSFVVCCPFRANTSRSTLTNIEFRCTYSVAEDDGGLIRATSVISRRDFALGADEGRSEIAGSGIARI